MKPVLIFCVLVIAGVLAFIRLAPSNPDIWHVDPQAAKKPRKPNAFILRPDSEKHPSPEFAMTAGALAQAFDDLALSDAGVSRLAGTPEELWVTYIARSRVMGYPDYISVRFLELGQNRSTLAVYSRARFGYRDFGVNRSRVLGWIRRIVDSVD